jgi:hypothetical protein
MGVSKESFRGFLEKGDRRRPIARHEEQKQTKSPARVPFLHLWPRAVFASIALCQYGTEANVI